MTPRAWSMVVVLLTVSVNSCGGDRPPAGAGRDTVRARAELRSAGSWLIDAAAAGNVRLIRELLAAGADVNENYGSEDFRTPLMIAAVTGHEEAVRALVEAGARIEGTEELSVLGRAAERGQLAVVRYLVSAGAELTGGGEYDRSPPLWAAARVGHVEVVRTLLAAGANPNEQGPHGTPLSAAAQAGHLEVVRTLLAAGADPCAPGSAAAAAGAGRQEVVEAIAEAASVRGGCR